MKQKIIIGAMSVLAIASLTACSAGGGSTSTGSSDPVTIAMISPLTGSLSSLGIDATAAAKQVVDQVNSSGGVDGRQINLVVKDDTSDVTQSVALFNQEAADPSVSLILSSVSAAASAASGSSAESAEIPMLSIGPVSAYVGGSNKYAFGVAASTAVVSQTLADFYKSTRVKKLAIAYLSQSSEMQPAANATATDAQAAGVDVVLQEGFDATATDFTPLITHVKASGADALQIWGPGAAPAILAKQMASQGIQILGTGAQASQQFITPVGAAAEGIELSANTAMAGSDIPAGDFKTLVDNFASTWATTHNGAYPPQFAFDAGTSIQLAAAAIDKAGSTDRAAITDALSNLSVLTLNSRFNYTPTNHSGLDSSAVVVVEIKNGQFAATPYSIAQMATNVPK
ncbi:ABC transporter substrate-binding protein [Subtercola sp. RTI3]|uniref:ABC transporter substrate-binding protein n=1 Tax=Subtercola sp. RTI3 TaxID=3048639 RepID=UPI002B23744D|nr:ABC transporter substrate-binding protein [Subtercola sp. RTI3]